MKPSTGDVLALVSKPDYDPSEIAQKWSSFSNSEDGVLLNRATQGLYPPGSTFKMLTLLEYPVSYTHLTSSCRSALSKDRRASIRSPMLNSINKLWFKSLSALG